MPVYNGYTYTPYSAPSTAVSGDIYSFNKSGKTGNYTYSYNGSPITRTQFGDALGVDTSKIESGQVENSGHYYKEAPVINDAPAVDYAAQAAAINAANERAAYGDQITNLDKLLGFAATKKQQGIQSIEDQYNQTKGQQEQVFNKQRLQNTQNQEKGYNEVGTFANTSNNNLQRLLQGANAGRSSVGQVLAPYMVGRSADTRRKAVTDTAGENAANIDTTATTTFQDLLNQKKKNLNDYESSIGNTQQDLEQQKIDATRARDMANGATYAQTIANTHGLTANMDNRRNQLAALFDKYKPDYSVAKAPELSTYQVDPAQIKANQNNPSGSDFYLNQLKRKKELGL